MVAKVRADQARGHAVLGQCRTSVGKFGHKTGVTRIGQIAVFIGFVLHAGILAVFFHQGLEIAALVHELEHAFGLLADGQQVLLALFVGRRRDGFIVVRAQVLDVLLLLVGQRNEDMLDIVASLGGVVNGRAVFKVGNIRGKIRIVLFLRGGNLIGKFDLGLFLGDRDVLGHIVVELIGRDAGHAVFLHLVQRQAILAQVVFNGLRSLGFRILHRIIRLEVLD